MVMERLEKADMQILARIMVTVEISGVLVPTEYGGRIL